MRVLCKFVFVALLFTGAVALALLAPQAALARGKAHVGGQNAVGRKPGDESLT